MSHARMVGPAVLIAAVFGLPGQVRGDVPAGCKHPAISILRYDEHYSFLSDPKCRTDFWDWIKYLPPGRGYARKIYLTLGGEMRQGYEYFHNDNFGAGPQSAFGYSLQRYMLHGDLHLGPHVRTFLQFMSALEFGRNGGPRPSIDQDQLDVHQAFVDIDFEVAKFHLMLRGGRQTLEYGAGRLIDVREGPNVRISFDGFRIIAQHDKFSIDGFVTSPVLNLNGGGIFENPPDFNTLFWGIYATIPTVIIAHGSLDLYYLGLDRRNAMFSSGTAHESRQTVGARFWGVAGRYDYDLEGVYQFGRFGNGPIQAWTVASSQGVTIGPNWATVRFGLNADIASGSLHRTGPSLETFNALFPKGAYFGQIGLLGPANFIDLHPSIALRLIERWSLTWDWDFFWRESTNDGIYNLAIVPLAPPAGTPLPPDSSRYIGSQLSTNVEFDLGRHLILVAIYTHFFAGAFLRETTPGLDIDYFTFLAQYRF
jgi:hypothetical protein